jgi:hypothetical protein
VVFKAVLYVDEDKISSLYNETAIDEAEGIEELIWQEFGWLGESGISLGSLEKVEEGDSDALQ